MRKIVIVVVVVALLAAGLWWFAGRDGAPGAAGDANAPLAFVPADAPYVFASLAPFPPAVADRWMEQFGASTELWRTQLDMLTRNIDATTPAGKWMAAISAEIDGKTARQVMEDNGLSMTPNFAMYGIGLAPVIRSEVADAAKIRALIGRVEQRAGETIPQATLDDVTYWYFQFPDAALRAIVALQGNHLVLTVGPSADDAALRILLGVERPSSSMRDGKALAALNTEYGYLPYSSGYVDTRRVVDLITSPATPLETALLAAMQIEKPVVDAACKAEYQVLAALVPRTSFGYTALDNTRIDALMQIETHPRIASDLMQLRSPLPGAKAAANSLFNFGFALKAGALPGVLNGWADIVAAQTWACGTLAPLAGMADELRTAGANPAIYSTAPMLSAFHVIATRADFASFQTDTPDGAGKVLIASPNPAALISMASTFMPEIASLGLKPDGKVLPLPAVPMSPVNLPMFAAMSDQVLAIGIGAEQEATLGSDLAIDPAYQPLLVYGITGAFYAQIGKYGLSQAALAEDDPTARAEAERMATLLEEIYTKTIKRIDVSIEVNERGLRYVQTMEMP